MVRATNAAAKTKNKIRRRRLRRIGFAKGSSDLGKKKNDPNHRLEMLERVTGWGTLIILAGIAIEIWLFFAFDPHDSRERVWTLAANILIALGLIVEYIAILKTIVAAREAKIESEKEIGALRARASEANQKAAEAELALAELEERLAPRRMTQAGQKLIASRISAFGGITGGIGTSPPDAESMRLENAIHAALLGGGWEIKRGEPMYTPVFPGGVCIQTTDHGLACIAGVTLAEVLNELGIYAVPMPLLEGDPPRIFVLVGPKPDPTPDRADAARIINGVKAMIGKAMAARFTDERGRTS